MEWTRRLLVLAGGWTVTLAAGAAALPPGPWGGDRLRLAVESQGASVEMDCASGRIDGAIALAADGSFDARGAFAEHRPGPQRADVAAPAAQARFSGKVRGDTMQLSILAEGMPSALDFTLQRGAAVKLVRCL